MENLEKQLNLSESEQEKLVELLNIVKPLFDSFTDSNEAYETAVKMNEFYDSLKEKGVNPRDYYLWSLLSPDNSHPASSDFDTPDREIEAFIKSLASQEEEKIAA
jgi:uncharacterized protein (UPF0297 family)